MYERTCRKCGSLCELSRDCEYPKLFMWCDECNDYADIDDSELLADVTGDMIDGAVAKAETRAANKEG